jgi:predicted dehydrogenase
MSDSNTITIGVIGAGGNTRNKHIPLLQAINGVTIKSVCNRSMESSRKVAEQFNIPNPCDTPSDIFNDADIDAVVIGTWPNMHNELTCAALKAGKHVMCEARMARNLDEARDMLDASKAHPDLIAQIVPSPFTLEVDTRIQSLITNGDIGDILAVQAFLCGNAFIESETPKTWRQDKDISGLNIMGLGIFYEALMRWVGHVSTVSAIGTVNVNQRGGEAIEIPDHIDVIGRLKNGGQLNMTMSAVTGMAEQDHTIYVFGSDATLKVKGNQLEIAKRGDESYSVVDIPDNERIGWRVEEEFIGAIRGTEPLTLTDFETGLLYMEFTEAVARSIETGQHIELPL